MDSHQYLYQCPYTFCNRGEAYPSQVLTNYCYISWEGQYWDLLLNRNNWHTGWIPERNLAGPKSFRSCEDLADWRYGLPDTLYQCPFYECNQGQIHNGDKAISFCAIDRSSVRPWALQINLANYHEGWTQRYDTGGKPEC